MVKRLSLTLIGVFLLALSASAQVETYQIDPMHSAAQFSIRHMGISTVRGAFSKVTGTVQFDPSDVTKTSIDATIDTNTIDTRVEMRDKDLKGPNYFDVAKYPTMTFKSKKVESAGTGKLKITGDLTMHGTTKEVVLQVEGPNGPMKDPKGNSHLGASATTQISRKDFGVSGGAGMVGDDVSITLDIEMVKPATAPAAK